VEVVGNIAGRTLKEIQSILTRRTKEQVLRSRKGGNGQLIRNKEKGNAVCGLDETRLFPDERIAHAID